MKSTFSVLLILLTFIGCGAQIETASRSTQVQDIVATSTIETLKYSYVVTPQMQSEDDWILVSSGSPSGYLEVFYEVENVWSSGEDFVVIFKTDLLQFPAHFMIRLTDLATGNVLAEAVVVPEAITKGGVTLYHGIGVLSYSM